MRELPDEGRSSPSQIVPGMQRTPKKTNHQLARYRVEIRKISKRLNAYAEGSNVHDAVVMQLLQDTRSQVLNLHIARKNLNQKKPRRTPNSHHRHKKPRS